MWMFTKHNPVNMAIRHKHLKLEQTKIDRARRLLDVRTEQETVELALDMVIAEEAILRAHRKVKGTGGVVGTGGIVGTGGTLGSSGGTIIPGLALSLIHI